MRVLSTIISIEALRVRPQIFYAQFFIECFQLTVVQILMLWRRAHKNSSLIMTQIQSEWWWRKKNPGKIQTVLSILN